MLDGRFLAVWLRQAVLHRSCRDAIGEVFREREDQDAPCSLREMGVLGRRRASPFAFSRVRRREVCDLNELALGMGRTGEDI